MQQNPLQPESRLPHRLAIALACATFPLIWVGGLVTTTDAGMAVPDWPSTFGHNLFLYPWTTWIAGPWNVFVEHGHRLFGSIVGLITIVLLVALLRHEQRRWVKQLGVILLAGVIAQGVLGGLRVVYDSPMLAMAHGCTGPLFFALTVAMVIVTSRRWRESRGDTEHPQAGRLHLLAAVTALLAYAQLVLGAQLRHRVAGADPALFQAALVMHIAVALGLVVHSLLLIVRVRRFHAKTPPLRLLARTLTALLLVQLLLGAATYVVNYGYPVWLRDYSWAADFTVQAKSFLQTQITTAHVAVGSLILATAVAASVWSWRLVRSPVAAAQPKGVAWGAAG